VNVLITDVNGCTYSLTTYIQVYEDTVSLGDIYVGNAFTPDGDGINDHMIMVSKDRGAMLIELAVLDRWGTLLYHMKDLPLIDFRGWDGTYKGKSLNPQVCVFFARVRMSDGKERQVRGDVILMK
jgi:gliding motility-associated-like protein